MALILIRDLDGKGNYDIARGRRTPLTKTVGPGGRDVWQRTGGDALVLDLGKAADMVFAPWVAVHCASGRPQEDAIVKHCEQAWGDDPPIVRLDPSGRDRPDVWAEFCRRHPDIMPTANPGTMEYMQQTLAIAERYGAAVGSTGIRRAVNALKINEIVNATQGDVDELIAANGTKGAAGRKVGGDIERSTREGKVDQQAQTDRMNAYAEGVYNEKYAEHRAAGKTEGQAKAWAERSREKALRNEADA